MKIDKSKFQNVINAFNTLYGCTFDLNDFENKLEKFNKDRTPDRANKLYKETFEKLYAQAIVYADDEGKRLSSKQFIDTFEKSVIAPFLAAREEQGVNNVLQPYGGMSEKDRLIFMHRCLDKMPTSLPLRLLREYENGRLSLQNIYGFANEIFQDPKSASDYDKKQLAGCIIALERSIANREESGKGINSKQDIAEKEACEKLEEDFIKHFQEPVYRRFRFMSSSDSRNIGNQQVVIESDLYNNFEYEYTIEEPQKQEAPQNVIEEQVQAPTEPEPAKLFEGNDVYDVIGNFEKATQDSIIPPTYRIQDEYRKGRRPLREMRDMAQKICSNPGKADERVKKFFAAHISAVEQLHDTRSIAWMIRHPFRYYAEYRDTRDMKAMFIKNFGEEQFKLSVECADSNLTEEQAKEKMAEEAQSQKMKEESKKEAVTQNDPERELLGLSINDIEDDIITERSEHVQQTNVPTKDQHRF